MADVLPAWVEGQLRRWGRQRRRILTGVRHFGDGWQHIDGWPTVSVAAMATEGGLTGGSGSATQSYPEVYSEDIVPTWQAVMSLREPHRSVVNIHYVLPLHWKAKAEALGVSTKTYYERLAKAKKALTPLLVHFDSIKTISSARALRIC